jgi:hypothetical protein
MKRIKIILLGTAILMLTNCKKQIETPKVIYEDTKKTVVQPIKIDSSEIEIADLPIQFKGTNFLIFPIGNIHVYSRNSKSSFDSSSSESDTSYKISNNNENEITGYLTNLKFQETQSDSLKVLTDKPVLIQSVTYINTFFKKNIQQLLVYSLADMDTNRDGKLDTNDIKSLYISDVSGNRFTKLSVDFEEIIDWNIIDSKNRLYFRTIEDTNKNGEFDKGDVIHYNFVNLLSKDWKSETYKPL